MRFRRRPHFLRTLTLVIAAGAITGLAAASKVGPFHGLGVVSHPVAATLAQHDLRADQFFPEPTSPATLKQVIEVQDPPAQTKAPEPSDAPEPSETSAPSESAEPTSSATSQQCFDDCGEQSQSGSGSGGDGGGGD